jgi:hypothetical protein
MAITRISNIANTLPDDSISNSKLQDVVNFKNIIINGDMSIAQRGTSATGLGNGDTGYHTIDRYRFAEAGSPTFEFTQSQDTDVPSGQGFATSLKMDCTTAQGSLSASDVFYIEQRTEAQNLQYLKFGTSSATSLTLSFWVKSNKTGTYICLLYNIDPSRHISQSYTINSANTWEKKTLTFTGDTTGVINNDNGLGFITRWYLGAGTDYSSGTLQTSWGSENLTDQAVGQVNLADNTANNFWITGVQLEAGETASDFEFLPYDVNLQRCLRYYHLLDDGDNTSGIAMATSYTATTAYAVVPLNPEMRTTPSIDQVAGTSYYAYLNEGTGKTFDSFTTSASSATNKFVRINNVDTISTTTGTSGWFKTDNTSAYFAFDAEL